MADAPKGGDAMGDLWWFVGVIGLLFFLWYALGGPSAPAQPLFVSLDIEQTPSTPSELTALEDAQGSRYERERISEAVRTLELDVEDMEEAVAEARLRAPASPYEGLVYISNESRGDATLAQEEYIVIEASSGNDIDVDITGWKLESYMTGYYAILGRASPLPVMGAQNEQRPVILSPGGSAVVSSGDSPVGTSFRINRCTGYFEQFQNFSPELPQYCPSPVDEFDDVFKERSVTTLDRKEADYNICRDFLWNIPECTIYRKDLRDVEPSLTAACQRFVRDTLSYQGCVDRHRYSFNFYEDEWRLYMKSRGELWRDQREILRLLDASGRTVDVYVY